ncbi:unnamed protein product, partial [Prorocentrum cordatum]
MATTMFRAPRMVAESGAWLEGLSKSEAVQMLVVLPWAVVILSILLHAALYATHLRFHRLTVEVDYIERGIHMVLAAACGLYLLVALLCERACSCCRRQGPRRPKEGWAALVPLLMCALFSAAYAVSRHAENLSQKRSRFMFIQGSLQFRAG